MQYAYPCEIIGNEEDGQGFGDPPNAEILQRVRRRVRQINRWDHWELYEVFRRGTFDERRALELSTTGTPALRCALQLLLLWQPNLAIRGAHNSQ